MQKVLMVFHPLIDAQSYLRSGGQNFAPHHFWGMDLLREEGYDVKVLCSNVGSSFVNRIGNLFKLNLLQQQFDCLRQSKDYDFVFFPFMEFSFLVAFCRLVGILRKPIVSFAQFSYRSTNRNQFKRWRQDLVRYIYFKGTDHVVFYNKPLYDHSMAGVLKSDAIFIDGWGVDDGFFTSFQKEQKDPAKNNYIFCTGGSYRDFPTLIKAFRELTCRLKITTIGSLGQIGDVELTDNIVVDNDLPFGLGATGILRREYYNALAVAIPLLPTEYPEPYGITVLFEALAMAKPVITTKNPAYAFDVEEEGVGINVDYGDVDGWKQAVQYLSSHPHEAMEMGKRGKRLVERKYNYHLFGNRLNAYLKNHLK